MLWNEIVSSVCICCSATIFSLSLLVKTKIKMLFIQMFASVLYISSYLFALVTNSVALMGAITAGFEFVRLIVFFLIERSEKYNTPKINLIAVLSFSIGLTICAIFAWSGYVSILPLIGSIIVSVALGSRNVLIIKIACIIQAALISVYLFLMSLWINASSQLVVFVLGVVGLILYLSDKKTEKSKKTR